MKITSEALWRRVRDINDRPALNLLRQIWLRSREHVHPDSILGRIYQDCQDVYDLVYAFRALEREKHWDIPRLIDDM